MMADTMDMAFDSPEADAEADSVYNQILEEQGIVDSSEMKVGTGNIAQGNAVGQPAQPNEVDDLQARLDNLNN